MMKTKIKNQGIKSIWGRRLAVVATLAGLGLTIPLPAQQHEDERPRMPYLPNAFGNQRTTPAYGYSSGANKVAGSSITTTQVNVGSTHQNIVGDAANEPSLTMNPLNTMEIAVGWRQFDNVASDFRQAGNGYSTDGGLSWNFQSPIDAGVFRSDPVLDYYSDGTLYYNSLTRDLSNNYNCNVYTSTDGGANWGGGANIGGGDKQWMAVDRTGGASDGYIYSAWSQAFSGCGGAFTRSFDGGNTWATCATLLGDPYWVNMAISPDGFVNVVGYGGAVDGLAFVKSPTAHIFGQSVMWNAPLDVFMDGAPGIQHPINPVGLLGQPNLEVDISGGPSDGYLYILSTVARVSVPDPADVMFSRSTDGGLTWSAPVRVNDDVGTAGIQWFGTMSIAPNGRLDVVWLDTRDAISGSDSSALYYSYSTDQGQTWSVNERMSPLFDPHVGYPVQQKMGDYFDMVSTDDAAHLAWAGTFNGEEDVYYSRIVPGVIAGVSSPQGAVVSVSPNPTQGRIWVRGCPVGAHVSLTDLLGRRLTEAVATDGTAELDLSGQPAGVYLVQVAGAGSVRVVRR